MEQITPQYKRGKYIRRRTRKRAKKIAIICLCVAILLAAAALLFFFRGRIFGSDETIPAATGESGVPISTATPTDANGNPVSTAAPTEEATEAPRRGTEVLLADGKLLLTYDSSALSLIEDTKLTSLVEKSADTQIPRMDLQKLPGKLGMLRDSELERIAIGLMQAYYYHPQHTADVDLTVLRNDKHEFAAEMQVPAIDDAPAAVCSVRLIAVGDELWAVVLLQPEGTENAALTSAFQGLTPSGENG